jgi:hypothetical protein
MWQKIGGDSGIPATHLASAVLLLYLFFIMHPWPEATHLQQCWQRCHPSHMHTLAIRLPLYGI